jgi:membrane protein YdbS with pleckstrin-like domain
MQWIPFLLFSGSIWMIVLKFLLVLPFTVMISRLAINRWEKICWILLAFLFTWLTIFVFYMFRNSFILLKRERRKFNPQFRRDGDETLNTPNV